MPSKSPAAGETISFTFQTTKADSVINDYACTVRFDAKRGVYRYEYSGKTRIIKDASFGEYEFFDPYVYNNRTAGPDVKHTWQPAGHKWWVYQSVNGDWQRVPLVDYAGDINSDYINLSTKWGKFDDFLYPDPVACPYFENEIGWTQPQGRSYSLGQCMWGYDLPSPRSRWPHDAAGRHRAPLRLHLPPRCRRRTRNALYGKAVLLPKMQNDKTVINPFIPSGNTFATALTLQDPTSAQMAWGWRYARHHRRPRRHLLAAPRRQQ